MSDDLASLWPVAVSLAQTGRGRTTLSIEADPMICAAVARRLDLEALVSLSATIRLVPWLDGAQVDGRWTARATRLCGLTLAPFDVDLRGAFRVRFVPADSLNAPTEDAEASFDPEADDPPDVLAGDDIPLGGVVIEHFALELDPFPRAPGASFDPPEPTAEPSPFAALARLRPVGD